ncbi:MAG: tRNA (cytidine(34)-2'-O)-methyltransferase [Proteobacteria bacterium]|nr:tRNA (cytidine(34)-2'-O)-methyltransferase [Pseudomonadota bacterium]
MFTVALLEPQIPPNTGNIARLCAAVDVRLEIVGEIGFELTDRYLKRAGLDYWEFVNWEYFENTEDYISKLDSDRIHLLTTKSDSSYAEQTFNSGDFLIFGSETKGISDVYLNRFAARCCTVPMKNPGIRSLNLSNTVAIVLYEAIRQNSSYFK